MEMANGKHKGKTTAEIFLKEPDYAIWYMGELPESRAGKDLRRLEKIFDEKPLTAKCDGCSGKAIGVSGYQGGDMLYFWCAECNPTSSGAEARKLRYPINTYREVLAHVDLTRGGASIKKAIVRNLAEAKGLTKPLNKKKLESFFATK
jgi:hypothetical protein